MKRKYRGILIFVLSFAIVGYASAGGGSEERFLVVQGVHKLEKITDLTSYRSASAGNPNEVIVSHGCEDYNVEYYLYGSPHDSDTVDVRVSPGELCDLTSFVFPEATVIRVEVISGKYYLKDYSRILFEGDDPILVPYEIPSEWCIDGINRTRKKNDSPSPELCEKKSYFSAREMENMLSSSHVYDAGELLCHKDAFPLLITDIAVPQLKTAQGSKYLKAGKNCETK